MPTRPPGLLRALLTPSMLLLHLAGIVAVIATVWLGQWQIGAWQDHRRDRTAELAQEPPVPLAAVMGADDPFPADGVGRPVAMAGRWLADATVFVSGRARDAATAGSSRGYWMVTPLSTCGSTRPEGCAEPSAVPVVLGWTRRVADAPAPPRGTASLAGWLQPGESADGTPDPDPGDEVLSSLRISALVQRVGQDLYSGYVILDTPAEARHGLTAVTPSSLPHPSSFTALRNLLYGIQWWIFGGFAVFMWWRWTRDELHRGTEGDEPSTDAARATVGVSATEPEPTARERVPAEQDPAGPRIRSRS